MPTAAFGQQFPPARDAGTESIVSMIVLRRTLTVQNVETVELLCKDAVRSAADRRCLVQLRFLPIMLEVQKSVLRLGQGFRSGSARRARCDRSHVKSRSDAEEEEEANEQTSSALMHSRSCL